MKMKECMKRGMALALTGAMAVTVLAGCGGGDKPADSSAESKSSEAPAASTDSSSAEDTGAADSGAADTGAANDDAKPFDGVTLKWALTDNAASGEETKEMVALIKEKTGINVEFSITPHQQRR